MKSFLAGRTEVRATSLQSVAGSTPAKPGAPARAGGNAPHAHEGAPAPTVETIKQGDKVVRLIVTCSCGERIEIDCLYPAGG